MKKLLKKLFLRLPLKKYILLESKPELSDNTYALFCEMLNRGMNNKYKLIWQVSKDGENYPKIKNVKYVNSQSKAWLYYLARAQMAIFCNSPISKINPKTKTLCLTHGSKSKNTRGKYEMPKDLDYILVQADMFKEAVSYGYNLSEKTQMITLGYPRNDDLLKSPPISVKDLFSEEFKRLIVWYPTFRQHKNGTNTINAGAIPIIEDAVSAAKLNEYAKKEGVLILIKPHFMQDVRYIKDNNLSHIRIIDDEFLKNRNIRSYQLLALSDALLTDYSSVYYDYLLIDKPIGLVWEDYEKYNKGQGFALNPDTVYSGGEKIFNLDEFCLFIHRISVGEDKLFEQRKIIKELSNVYTDCYSSKRVCDFILSNLEAKNAKKV